MAAEHGSQAVFKMDNTVGSIVDITTYCDTVDFPRSRDISEATCFGATGKAFLAGLRGATISIGGPYDPTVSAYLEHARTYRSTKSFEYGPQGLTGGLVKLSGEMLCTGYNISTPVADKGSFTAEFTVSGAVSAGTW